jgi:hypothetical protein
MAMKRDLKSNIDVAVTFVPATRSATGTGAAVDLQGYDSAMAIVEVGTMATDGTFTASLQESADGTTYTAVAQASLQGTFGAYGTANDPALERVGYIGTGRYLKGVFTFAGTGTGAITAMNIVRAHPARKPLA